MFQGTRKRQPDAEGKPAEFKVTSLLLIAVLTLCSVLAVAGPAQAEVKETITINYYSVSVPRNESLFPVLVAAFPLNSSHDRAVGHTDGYIKWSFNPVPFEGGMCKTSNVEVTWTETMTLPKLEDAEPAVRKQFDAAETEIP